MRKIKSKRESLKESVTKLTTSSAPQLNVKYLIIASIISIATGFFLAKISNISDSLPTSATTENARTEQHLEKAFDIQLHMEWKEVERIMGHPAKKEILGKIEEWHYCKTGEKIDDFIVIRFKEKRVIAMENYIVSSAHVSNLRGDCALFIKWGTHGESKPNKTFLPGTLLIRNEAASAPTF